MLLGCDERRNPRLGIVKAVRSLGTRRRLPVIQHTRASFGCPDESRCHDVQDCVWCKSEVAASRSVVRRRVGLTQISLTKPLSSLRPTTIASPLAAVEPKFELCSHRFRNLLILMAAFWILYPQRRGHSSSCRLGRHAPPSYLMTYLQAQGPLTHHFSGYGNRQLLLTKHHASVPELSPEW